MNRILSIVDAISRWTGNIVAFLIPAMMLITTYEVVMRYFFNAPTTWAMETTQYLFLATTALGGAYVLLQRGHVNVSILYDKLDRKTQAAVDIVTFFFFFAFMATLFWHTLDATLEAVKERQHSASFWGPPIYPVYIVMTVGIILMGLQGVAILIRNIMLLAGVPVERGPRQPE